MFLIYSLLFTLGLVVMGPYYLWRRRARFSREELRERFGFLPARMAQDSAGAVWVHAVSVGETLAVAKLIGDVARRYPEKKIFLSHVTPAGREAGERRAPNVAGRFYLPFDWAWSVRRTVGTIRPGVLLVAETELWPNLLRLAKASGARVGLVNARISDRSFRRYRIFRSLFGRILDSVDCVCAQTSRDAERFEANGMKAERVVVTGNLKFDAAPARESELADVLRAAFQAAGRGPVLIAASTMTGEENRVMDAWRIVRMKFPDALLILAPRHPVRFDGVARTVAAAGSTLVRRSELGPLAEEQPAELESADIFLLDSIGELAGLFPVADVVFVGGSLVPTGGHNLLEPAFSSKPILFGPHMANFRDVAELFLSEEAAIQAPDAEALGRNVVELFSDAPRRNALGGRARWLVAQQAGATERTLEQIKPWLDASIPAAARP